MDRTQYRINLEYRASVRAQTLAIAKQFLEEKLGLVQTSRELLQFRDGVEPEIGTLLDVFVGVASETDALPIGTERALWNLQALEMEDRKIAAAELRWHGRATEAARRLVGLLETAFVAEKAAD
jgi:hypothetical protein